MGRREFSAERRSLGSYYTSRSVADVLCSWAIRNCDDRILEPSFGGCEFITSVSSRLEMLGERNPLKNVFGADIDPKAFAALDATHPNALARNFRHGDFLGMTVQDLTGSGVDVVIGNPPYVRHHAISEDVFAKASRLRDSKLAHLPMQANLWAFFVIHACSFLRPHGRMAWVLPQNYFYASYAKSVRRFLRQNFRSTVEIEIRQHLFESEGAAEKSVLVFCDDWCPGADLEGSVRRYYADGIDAVPSLLLVAGEGSSELTGNKLLCAGSRTLRLGQICDVRIGTVLGDSRFFLFDSARADEHGIDPALLRLAVTKASIVQGLSVSASHLANAFHSGKKVAVLDTAVGSDDSVQRYLSLMPQSKIDDNVTFGKRPIWHQPFGSSYRIDAFFTGMSHLFPRLALNPHNLRCTNALYELQFKGNLGEPQKLQLPLSMISAFGQLSSEIEGRPYGSGLLKHEPSDVRRIQVLSVEAETGEIVAAFNRADVVMRKGDFEAATSIADDFFIAHGAFSSGDVVDFKARANAKRRERLRSRVKRA
ncbi:N-6 DNA methylase [Rhizobium leguminosarum]|uniref:N-6 DNA methylase n=1 Tax=Rhizobium leguminosarum TaxID=384 RepID=UPI001C95DB1C|nr:N-6 DNA methylase [Rhizobium leguminosarum]MBY5445947.1 N-6 DNA methylase [Rhizobium leguminosarum]